MRGRGGKEGGDERKGMRGRGGTGVGGRGWEKEDWRKGREEGKRRKGRDRHKTPVSEMNRLCWLTWNWNNDSLGMSRTCTKQE